MRAKLEKLESLRGFAALYVVLHHLKIGEGTWLTMLTRQGQVAVILFFVLSGFVIYLSISRADFHNRANLKKYLVKRFRRIYPVLLVALIVAYAMAAINAGSMLPFDIKNLLLNILNLQDLNRHPGYWGLAYYGNTPLWSLSYEWWFYIMLIPFLRLVRPDHHRKAALIISCFGFFTYWLYPNQISIILEYYLIWWWGAELAKSYIAHRRIDSGTIRYILFSAGVLLTLQIVQIASFSEPLRLTHHPVIQLRHFVYALLLILIGYGWKALKFRGFKYTFDVFKYFAPISYGIYVFHYPMIMKYDLGVFDNIWIQYTLMLLVVFFLSYLVEVKLQSVINAWTNKLSFMKRRS